MAAAHPTSREELLALARRLIEGAARTGLGLRAMGGIGIAMRTAGADPALQREYADIDLAAPRRARRDVEDAMRGAGLEPEREFNAIQGGRRQIWWTADGGLHVDVFLGEFAMCHRLDLEPGLTARGAALPATDLLLTKLQVVELNLKDAKDAAALLTTHAVSETDGEDTISLPRLRDVLAGDWGFYTTASDNLARIPEAVSQHVPGVAGAVAGVCETLAAELERAPKPAAFRIRAKVGRRRRWYDIPEETVQPS
jgi:hypothetical protein